MKKEIKLYNVLFPFWMLMLFPVTWLVIIPGNFIIDSLVLVAAMFALKIEQKKQFYKSHILKIFGFGMLSDIIGSAYMFVFVLCGAARMGDEWYITVPALVISGTLIFVFNYFVSFRKSEKRLRVPLSLTFAIATAPYTFLIPSSWLY